MILSILMPCLSHRKWEPLYRELLTQAGPYPGEVEVLTEVDDGRRPSGAKRNSMVDRARGRYRTFVDDDDWVSTEYVERLLGVCRSGVPDVVTFDLAFRRPGSRQERWTFTLDSNDRDNGTMAANHLCAWRREVADRIRWCDELGHGDDQLWNKPLMAIGLPLIRRHVAEVLYVYQYDPDKTVNQRPDFIEWAARYFGGGLQCWRNSAGEVFIQDGASSRVVRDRYNNLRTTDGLTPFYTVYRES